MISAMVSRSMVKRKRQTRPGMMRRVIAAACVAVVFALGLFAASPVLHEVRYAVLHAVFVHSPAYRLLPGRGPPVGKV